MKNPKSPGQPVDSPFMLGGLTSLFTRKRSAVPVSTSNLAGCLVEIKANHTTLCASVAQYADEVTKGQHFLEEQMAKLRASRLDAAEAKHLPDAVLAQELAAAERQAVVGACRATLANMAALVDRLRVPTGEALAADLQRAVGPLRELLAALPKDSQAEPGSP